MAPRQRRSVDPSPSSDSSYNEARLEVEFPDDDTCLEWLKNRLYPEGITCPWCERTTPHHRVVSRPSYSCDRCGHHVHPTAGTIFHKSSTSLHLWFRAVYRMSSTRCGVSAKQLERELGVTYKTALRMAHLIRSMLDDSDDGPLGGEVEMDETYLTRRRRRKGEPPRMGGRNRERVVMGAVERGGRVVARYVPSASTEGVETMARLFVLPESVVYTDEHPSYAVIGRRGYQHKRIRHIAQVYVDGPVHTQTIEGFWSLVKRGLDGVYHSVSSRHLQGYLDEYAFRYSHRHDAQPMFYAFLDRVARRVPASD
jgi:transposase